MESKEFIRANPEYGNWVFYPWNNVALRILEKSEFVELRTSRNRNKITKLANDIGVSRGTLYNWRKAGKIKFVKSTTNANNKLAKTKEDNQLPRKSKVKGAITESVDQRNNTPSSQGNHQHGRN